MVIHWERLVFVIPAGVAACLLLDAFIWWLNRRWLHLHPKRPRHPYSPLFTALGVVIVHVCTAFIIPWRYVAISFGAFCIFGGLMWGLHQYRWWTRLD